MKRVLELAIFVLVDVALSPLCMILIIFGAIMAIAAKNIDILFGTLEITTIEYPRHIWNIVMRGNFVRSEIDDLMSKIERTF